MKKRYIVGFFSVIVIIWALLSAGYRISYERVAERNASPGNGASDTQSISAEGEAVNEKEKEGYYLCERQGFIVVYLSDRNTIYEMTEIPLTDLPEEVQQEIIDGKYISTLEELYGFLENYSS